MATDTFDLNDPDSTRLIKDSPEDRMVIIDVEGDQEEYSNPLDSPESQLLHTRLMNFYRQELDRQRDNRVEQAIEEDYYDNIQWSEEDASVLRERGQVPLVYNVISQSVNWVIGSEKRGRTDFKVLPRRKEDGKQAEKKTQLLKYISDCNRTPFARSRAFEDAVKVGIGWMEDGCNDNQDGELIYSRYESWRNMLWDSASTEMDLSDARYIIRTKWVDVDIAVAMFPDREDLIRQSADKGDDFGSWSADADGDEIMDSTEESLSTTYGITGEYDRPRVRMIEMWYVKPERLQRLRALNHDLNGEIYDPGDPRHTEALQSGIVNVAEGVMMRMHVAVMTIGGLCYEGPTPYRHNRYPFTPIWSYRRGRDGMPYGMIRYMRDLQDDINKRASKAQFILSSNKIIMDEGAVDDVDKLAEEVARPDGIIEKKTGKELTINADRDLAPAHLQLMQQSMSMIQTASGVTDELMGRKTNAVSGVAVQARQEQGSLATAKIFDNLRLSEQIRGEKLLSLTEQFYTEQKQFRITNMRGNPEYIDINDGLPENDISRTKADFVIGEAEWRNTIRQSNAEQLMEMISRMPPEIALVLLDLAVDNMDLPNREEVSRRIRAINGQSDPDATEPSPDDIARKQAQQKQQQQQEQMFMAQLRKLVADAMKAEAEAAKSQAGVTLTQQQAVQTGVDAAKDALDAATLIAQSPVLAPLADNILLESGWKNMQITPQTTQAKGENVAQSGTIQNREIPENTNQV